MYLGCRHRRCFPSVSEFSFSHFTFPFSFSFFRFFIFVFHFFDFLLSQCYCPYLQLPYAHFQFYCHRYSLSLSLSRAPSGSASYAYSSSSSSDFSGRPYLGQHMPSVPSMLKQKMLRSSSVGSWGTMPCTSFSSATGNQAGSESSTTLMPHRLWIEGLRKG